MFYRMRHPLTIDTGLSDTGHYLSLVSRSPLSHRTTLPVAHLERPSPSRSKYLVLMGFVLTAFNNKHDRILSPQDSIFITRD